MGLALVGGCGNLGTRPVTDRDGSAAVNAARQYGQSVRRRRQLRAGGVGRADQPGWIHTDQQPRRRRGAARVRRGRRYRLRCPRGRHGFPDRHRGGQKSPRPPVGINEAIASPTGAFIGIGFAIPINAARNIAQQSLPADGSFGLTWVSAVSPSSRFRPRPAPRPASTRR